MVRYTHVDRGRRRRADHDPQTALGLNQRPEEPPVSRHTPKPTGLPLYIFNRTERTGGLERTGMSFIRSAG